MSEQSYLHIQDSWTIDNLKLHSTLTMCLLSDSEDRDGKRSDVCIITVLIME